MYYAEDVVKQLRRYDQIIVFGAGIVAFNAINCLIRTPYRFKIEYCIVSDLSVNPKQIMGIPVIDFAMAEKKVKKDRIIMIAVTDKNLAVVQDMLYSHGYFNTLSIAFHSDLWEQIRGNYFREYCLLNKEPCVTLEEELKKISAPLYKTAAYDKIHIYEVRSHVDQRLIEETPDFKWEIPIQAGAALTRAKVCGIQDNIGDNISEKNREYCELTALYWIWKNDTSDYLGLCHYRRHFQLDWDIIRRLEHSDIDVVLTIPILNFPSVREVYENDHMIEDWDIMLEVIERFEPTYRKAAEIVQSGQYYYGYNMFIMRREILDNYCKWLFPILDYCERYCGKKKDSYQNRYLGFMAERLLTIYFIHHKKDYKIVHARKHFIEK